MKVVIISKLDRFDLIVVQEILQNFSNVTLIHLTSNQEKKKNSRNWINSTVKKLLRKIHKSKLSKSVKPYLSNDLIYEKIQFPSKKINSEEGIMLIRDLNPDILFTCTAPILKEPLIIIPKLAAINAHFGIPPKYRGNDSLFWALYYQDFENIGGCLHYISKGVDSGNILVEVRPALVKGDGELDLDIKVSTMLSQAAVQVLKIIQKSRIPPQGQIQMEKGRNFKASERTIRLELKFLFLKTIGYRRVESCQERVDFYI